MYTPTPNVPHTPNVYRVPAPQTKTRHWFYYSKLRNCVGRNELGDAAVQANHVNGQSKELARGREGQC